MRALFYPTSNGFLVITLISITHCTSKWFSCQYPLINYTDAEDEESTSKIKTVQKLKKVVKVITVPKNIENINMIEVKEKEQAVEEDGDPDDFTAIESIKDDLEEGMFFFEINCFYF